MTQTTDIPRCMVVDDDEMTGKAVSRILKADGFSVDVVIDGETAVRRCLAEVPDVIVLDLELPGINGHQAAKQIREIADPYILMLTGNQGEVEKVLALSTAMDDYMTKPFSTAELVARLHALLRRSRRDKAREQQPDAQPAQVVTLGSIVVDSHARRLTNNGADVAMTRIEFDIFYRLAREAGVCITRADLIKEVWGSESAASQHSLDVHVHNMRRKLDDAGVDGVTIEAVRSVGFRLVSRPLA